MLQFLGTLDPKLQEEVLSAAMGAALFLKSGVLTQRTEFFWYRCCLNRLVSPGARHSAIFMIQFPRTCQAEISLNGDKKPCVPDE